MKKSIEVRHGDEYRTKVSGIYNKDDFFYEAYRKAAQGVRDIVEATEKHHKNRCENRRREGRSRPGWDDWGRKSGRMERTSPEGYPNNFIAFCAGRGQGKTSAMVSFSTALRRLSEKEEQREFWGTDVLNSKFYVLAPIDPTMMNQEDSILRIVISRMFERYDTERERRRDWCGVSAEKEPELLNEFRQCYRSLDVLQKGRDLQDCYDDLDYLADLGDSSHMKESFQYLVSLFLELIYPKEDGERQRFLVIQIDDADLNASNAYRIVEELRKYCVVPNVVILMATDFEQLELTVEKHFLEELELLCKYKGEDKTILGRCHKMTERYLDKLLPGTRQIHLPLIDRYIKDQENELELSYYDKWGKSHPEDYQDLLLQMIYRKTGLVLMKPSNYLHNLLPKTMRELTHLLAFLSDLEDIDFENGALSKLIGAWGRTTPVQNEAAAENKLTEANLAALELRRKNVDAFMSYLRHCWAKAALTEDQQAVVAPAMETTMDMKIRRLLSDLRGYGVKKYGWSENAGDTGHSDARYVDVIETLNRMKTMPDCTEEYCLIYISATILSLYMHLLVMQDLKEGLEFKRLKGFVGEEIFPAEVREYCKDGVRYDRLDIGRDFVPQLAFMEGQLELAPARTRTLAQLLLTASKTNDRMPALKFEKSFLGSPAALYRIFWNSLEQTADNRDPAITTELLDIILSWDLQSRIMKKITSENRADQEKGWLSYEAWTTGRFHLIDEAYEGARTGLKFDTTSAVLENTFSEERRLLETLPIGNPAYAEQWWKKVRAELDENWAKAEQALSDAVKRQKSNGEQDRDAMLALSASLGQIIDGIVSTPVTDTSLLSEKALYRDGITPQDIIDRIRKLFPDVADYDDNQMFAWLQDRSENIGEIMETIARCREDLKKIRLYYQTAESAEKTGAQESLKVKPSKRGRRATQKQRRLSHPRFRKAGTSQTGKQASGPQESPEEEGPQST